MGNTTKSAVKCKTKDTKSTPIIQIDKATGLPLQEAFETAAEEIANEGDIRWVLALIDVDKLKIINDTESHEAGDIIIQTIGRAIHSQMQQNNERWRGYRSAPFGDEFYILIHCREGKKSYAERGISKLISKIEHTTTTTISVGLSYLMIDDTKDEWIERADKTMKYKKKKGGNGFSWDISKKKKKKKKQKNNIEKNKNKIKNKIDENTKKNGKIKLDFGDEKVNKLGKKLSKKEKAKAALEETKIEEHPNDWINKYNLNESRDIIKKKNWTVHKLYNVKDAEKLSGKLKLVFEQKIKFETGVQCLKERSLILKSREICKLRGGTIHRYDYIELNDKSVLTISDERGLLSIECFVMIMRKGSCINMNNKGQINGAGVGDSVLGIPKMPALGQPRGGGGGAGYGTCGGDGTVGKGGRIYFNYKLTLKYGQVVPEMLLGSAGGWSYNGDPQGEGGGGVKIVCLEKLVMYDNAKICCNGSDGKGSSGGGSGGSIMLRSPRVVIKNVNKYRIEAIGGKGGPEGGGEGGDGRIRIDCNNNDFDVVNKNIQPAIGYKGKFV
eukprot:1010765_1